MQRRQVLGWAVVSLALAACRKKNYYAPTAELEHGLHVRITHAYVRRDKFVVKAYMTNGGAQPLRVNRDMWALRLPNGKVLTADPSRNSTYEIAPGHGREIDTYFEAHDDEFDALANASVIIGGVMVGADPNPYVVGEVPLSKQPIDYYGAEPPPGGEPPPVATAEGAPPADQPPPNDQPPGSPPPPGQAAPPPPGQAVPSDVSSEPTAAPPAGEPAPPSVVPTQAPPAAPPPTH